MIAFLAQTLLPFLVVVAGAHDFLHVAHTQLAEWRHCAGLFSDGAHDGHAGRDDAVARARGRRAILAVSFGLFSFGFIGGGDAKMLAAAGLWFGWPARDQPSWFSPPLPAASSPSP